MGDDRTARLNEFLGKCAKKFGSERITLAGRASSTNVDRFSSGIFKLDAILGGGWPRNRIVLVHGPESSGKTTVVTKAASSLQEYCSTCKRHRAYCECTEFVKSRTLWIDQEGTFDERWAVASGFDMETNLLAKPDTAEDACDLISCALEEQVVDLIVLDSIEACVPKDELEQDSSDSSQPGLKARLMNKSFRKWSNTQTRLGDKSPTLICINQEREKIGVMYGNPMTLPGGKAQLFAPAIRLQLYRGEVKDVDGVSSAIHCMKATTKKNKTFTPQLEAMFDLSLRDHDGFSKGEFKNYAPLFKEAKSLGILGHKFTLPNEHELNFRIDGEVIDWLRTNPIVGMGKKNCITAMRHYWDEVLSRCLR